MRITIILLALLFAIPSYGIVEVADKDNLTAKEIKLREKYEKQKLKAEKKLEKRKDKIIKKLEARGIDGDVAASYLEDPRFILGLILIAGGLVLVIINILSWLGGLGILVGLILAILALLDA